MLQQYPSFTFNEKLIGPRPVRTFAVDVAGVVGQFVRGFQGVAFPCDGDEAFKRYGRRGLLNGDVGLQAIVAQGANAFLLSAVHGSAAPAKKTLTIKGLATASGTPELKITDNRPDVPVEYTYAPVDPLLSGATAKDVLDAFKALIDADVTAIVTMTVAGTGTDATAELTLKEVGILADGDVTAELVTTSIPAGFTDVTPNTASSPSQKALADGFDAPKRAELVLKDGANAAAGTDVLRLVVHYPGADGNNLKARIKVGSMPDKRTIEVYHTIDGLVDTIADIDLTDVEDQDLLVASKGKIFVEARVLDDTKALPTTTTDLAFTGGYDGAPVTTEDYLRAIDALELEPCSFILAPGPMPAGVSVAAIQTALVAQAEKINGELGEAHGLRVAVLHAPRGMSEADISNAHTVDSEHAIMVAGWVTAQFAPKLRRYGASPDAFYVGKAMRTALQVSVAARESSPAYKGVAEVDTPVGVKAWNLITAYRMDAIIKDPVLKVYQALNGRTTTSSPALAYWLCYRRVMNRIRTEVFQVIYTTMSEPSDAALDADIEARVNNILDGRMRQKMIRGFDPAVSNDTNNPPLERAAGKRNIDFGIELIPPNDFTTVNVSRVLRATVRL